MNPMTGTEISFNISGHEIVISEYQYHKVEELMDWLTQKQYERLDRKFPDETNKLIVKIKI